MSQKSAKQAFAMWRRGWLAPSSCAPLSRRPAKGSRTTADEKHVELLEEEVEAWRRKEPSVVPDLSWAELKGVKLFSANLRDAHTSSTRTSAGRTSSLRESQWGERQQG